MDRPSYSTYDTQLAQLPRDATLQVVLEEVEQRESLYVVEPAGDDSCQLVL